MGNLSQKKDVLAYLENEKTRDKGITDEDARVMFGAHRLSAIIWELRHKENRNIEGISETCKNRYGHISTYTRYFLKED